MLTLNFNKVITDPTINYGNHAYYYNNIADLHAMNFKFSTVIKELPFIMTANPSLHKKDSLYFSVNHPFAGRGLNMLRLKEILENAPVAIRVKLLSNYYLVGKGFIAKIVETNRDSETDDIVKLMFVVASDISRAISSPHELKIYLNREMYEPQYKRIMALLKPYMVDHKGDIIVTKSINDYLLYKFKLPDFSSIKQRVEFDENMKEFFFRSVKWTKWKEQEDNRIAEIEKNKEIKKLKNLRDKIFQERMIATLEAENIRISEPIIEPELVEEVPIVGEQEMTQRITEWAEDHLSTMRRMEVSLRDRLGERNQLIDGQESHQREQSLSPIEEPQVQSPLLQSLQSSNGQQPIRSQLQDTQDIPEEMDSQEEDMQDIQIQQPPSQQGEHVSPEEMERIMNSFAIAQPVDINYAIRLHPSTGLPIVDDQVDGNQANEMYIDEFTEVEIDEGEDERTEEELDNDPDAYEDAIIVESNSSERTVFSAMEGGTDGG